MPPNVQSFAGFTSSLPFRYSVIFIVRLNKSQTTPPLLGLSSFLYLSFRDCGCGKAMSFDGLSRRNRPNKTLQRTAAGMAVPCQSQRNTACYGGDLTGCYFLLTASKPSVLQSRHATKSHPW